jgi:type IV secretion system protein VirB4
VADGGARRAEATAEARLPYARHVSEAVIALDTGALMLCLKLTGAAFETADVRDLNDAHAKLNNAWRNLADDRLALWHHVIRREAQPPAERRFTSRFARDLDARHRARLGEGRLFVNELYLTLVRHPGRDRGDRLGAWLARRSAAQRPIPTRISPRWRGRRAISARTWSAMRPSASSCRTGAGSGSRNPWNCCA